MKKNYIIPTVRIVNSNFITSVIECSGVSMGTGDVGSKKFNYDGDDSDDNFWTTK